MLGTVRPRGTRILARQIKRPTSTPSGILLPFQDRYKTVKAEVVATGPDVSDVQAGDTIMHAQYSGTELTIDGVDYLLLEEDQVIGILPEPETRVV